MQSFHLSQSLAFDGSASTPSFTQQSSALKYRGRPSAESASVSVRANGLAGCYRGQQAQFSAPMVKLVQSAARRLQYRGVSH